MICKRSKTKIQSLSIHIRVIISAGRYRSHVFADALVLNEYFGVIIKKLDLFYLNCSFS